MKRRKIDSETKMTAVLEGFGGERSATDICRKFQVSESLYFRWRDKFLEGESGALVFRDGSDPEYAVKTKISELERIIGKHAVQIEILKKFRGRSAGGLTDQLVEGPWLSTHGDLSRLEMVSGHLISAGEGGAGGQFFSLKIAGEPRPRGRYEAVSKHEEDQTEPSILGLSPGSGLAETSGKSVGGS